MKQNIKELLRMGEVGWTILFAILPIFTAISFVAFGWWALLWAGLPIMYFAVEAGFKSSILESHNKNIQLAVGETKLMVSVIYLTLVFLYSVTLWFVFWVVPEIIQTTDWYAVSDWIFGAMFILAAIMLVGYLLYEIVKEWLETNRRKAEKLLGKNKVF